MPFLVLMEKLQNLLFYNFKGDKVISFSHIFTFVFFILSFFFKGLFKTENWIYESSAVIFGYLC